jgi:hypothetical protein
LLRIEDAGNSNICLRSSTVCGTMAAAMTPDIVANAIVAALSAGAVSGVEDTAKSAIANTYQGLKSEVLYE